MSAIVPKFTRMDLNNAVENFDRNDLLNIPAALVVGHRNARKEVISFH